MCFQWRGLVAWQDPIQRIMSVTARPTKDLRFLMPGGYIRIMNVIAASRSGRFQPLCGDYERITVPSWVFLRYRNSSFGRWNGRHVTSPSSSRHRKSTEKLAWTIWSCMSLRVLPLAAKSTANLGVKVMNFGAARTFPDRIFHDCRSINIYISG